MNRISEQVVAVDPTPPATLTVQMNSLDKQLARPIADLNKQLGIAFGPIATASRQVAMGLELGAGLDKQLGLMSRIEADFRKQLAFAAAPSVGFSKQLGSASGLGFSKQLGSASGLGFSKQLGSASGLGFSKQLGSASGLGFSKQLGSASGLGFSKQLGLTSRIEANFSKQLGLATAPSVDFGKQLGLASRLSSELFALRDSVGVAAVPLSPIRLSPELQQLFDDLGAAEGFDPAIAILSDQESDTPLHLFAADIAVPALTRKIRTLARTKSEQRLADAAWRLEQADARWREAGDDREFPVVIHDAVSALEEVARQIAARPDTKLSRALSALHANGTITGSQKRQMIQAWDLRNRVPGAGHGAGRAPRETAGFVLFRVRQGLRDLLDAVDADE